jgi:putative tricarboxylic transport membrane protein
MSITETKTASAPKWSPDRELEIVAGTPPGGGLDRAARALAKAINDNKLASVPVSVVNVPGDGARAAWGHLDKYKGDAHVVCISSPNLTTDKLVGLAKFDYRDYSPLAILYTEYIAFVARPDSKITDAKTLLEKLAKDPKGLTISLSTTLGNPNHIAVAQVAIGAGADVNAPTIRVFDTALDVIADVIAGNADVGAVTAASCVKELNAGNIRTLAISAPQRLTGLFANVPTWKELKIDCVIGSWRGLNGAAGLNAQQIKFWQDLTGRAVATKTWADELASLHWSEMYHSGDNLVHYLDQERRDYIEQLTALGLIKS